MVLTELRGQGTSQVVDYKEPKRASYGQVDGSREVIGWGKGQLDYSRELSRWGQMVER